MKQLFLVLIGAMMFFSCDREDVRELPSDAGKVSKLPTCPELVNIEMDNKAAQRRKYPPKNPHNQPPQPPPPTTVKQGCLLLDFNGEDVSGTMWNVNGDLVCDNSGLSQTQIEFTLNRVKYDYAQFNIEVTTDESVYNTYPQNKRRRCIVTTTNFYGNVGGVAYINSFNWFDDSPCFVFSQLLSYNEKYISDATSHELGHTLGNRHHSEWMYNEDGSCIKINEYLWSNMIMGASYYDPNPKFGIGANSLGCYVIQNDMDIINNSINQ
jgi:hypothetical protein